MIEMLGVTRRMKVYLLLVCVVWVGVNSANRRRADGERRGRRGQEAKIRKVRIIKVVK
jgi:hypothetical protein